MIPFPGIYQTDLVYLEGYGKDILDDGMVNFAKFQKVSEYVTELQSYQMAHYSFESKEEIRRYMQDYIPLGEDAAYEESLKCEPRV